MIYIYTDYCVNSNTVLEYLANWNSYSSNNITCTAPATTYSSWSCNGSGERVRTKTTYTPSCNDWACTYSSNSTTDTISCRNWLPSDVYWDRTCSWSNRVRTVGYYSPTCSAWVCWSSYNTYNQTSNCTWWWTNYWTRDCNPAWTLNLKRRVITTVPSCSAWTCTTSSTTTYENRTLNCTSGKTCYQTPAWWTCQ